MSLASILYMVALQACNAVHISVLSRNFSALTSITGPYAKTSFLHCNKFGTP